MWGAQACTHTHIHTQKAARHCRSKEQQLKFRQEAKRHKYGTDKKIEKGSSTSEHKKGHHEFPGNRLTKGTALLHNNVFLTK